MNYILGNILYYYRTYLLYPHRELDSEIRNISWFMFVLIISMLTISFKPNLLNLIIGAPIKLN